MKVPPKIIKENDNIYYFIKSYPCFYLYQEKKNGIKKTITPYELNYIDNANIDKMLGITRESRCNYYLYDRLFHTKTVFKCIDAIGEKIDLSVSVISRQIGIKLIGNRWFVEKKEINTMDENIEIINDDSYYTKREYEDAKKKGYDLDIWDDYRKYFELY